MTPRQAELAGMTALEARHAIARGAVKAVELTEACLAKISARETEVGAWAHLDANYAMQQAEAADRLRGSGRPLGILHGLPVGVKDIVDTRDFPTENGTPFDNGRRPVADAAVTVRLRQAGAIILGKTVTTELAAFSPGKTRNPNDRKRTPGGSSSGSAAAVAAGMVPLAVGTQTNGSVIRPASYCGVVGFKPTRGMIPRTGVLTQSETFDTIGTFSRTIEDTALLCDALAGFDAEDPASLLAAPPHLLETATSVPPVKPSLAFVRSPVWDKASVEVRKGFADLADVLGADMVEVELPPLFAKAHGWHWTINMSEMARNFARYYDRDPNLLSDRMRGMIEEGQTMRAVDYLRALDAIPVLGTTLDSLFDRFDAIVTPAAPGEAPLGQATGEPFFNTIWTFCGVPAVTLPLLSGPNGMPVGVQLVGRHLHDGRLLRTARWLLARLEAADAGPKTGQLAQPA